MSSAERMRRLRARQRIAGELVFVRQDWSLFLDPTRLPQKAGCTTSELRALVLKEVVDNGLDPGGSVTLEQLDPDTWVVTDDGPGLDRGQIAALFSPNRPLASSKLLRRPTRGMIGNGLRVVSGAAVASGGQLWVESRGRRYEIVTNPTTGASRAVPAPCDAPCRQGTKVTIRFGPALPRSDDDGRLARDALRFPGLACDPFRSHIGWYGAGPWHELIQAAPPGTSAAELLATMGIESHDRRPAAELTFEIASRVRSPAAPRMLPRGDGGLHGYAYAKEAGTEFQVECWAKAKGRAAPSRGKAPVRFYINRTPIVARAEVADDWLRVAGGFVAKIERVNLGAVYDIELSLTAPFIPLVNDGKTPDLYRWGRRIAAVVERAMRDAYREVAPAKPKKGDIKAAAWAVMAAAYAHAAGGLRVANARQVMYAARRQMEYLLGKGAEPVSDKYFTQVLLPDYIAAHEVECATWDVIYDDRGHLIEPHTHRNVPLGTIAVRDYALPRVNGFGSAASIGVAGGGIDVDAEPINRYRTALFIEKEGFVPLLQAARIAERFDCAILSTKGMSTVAARHLLDKLGRDGVVILIAHDFDRTGLAIEHTLHSDSRRYRFEHPPAMIDIGLTLADARRMNLQDEPAPDGGPTADKLASYGVGDEEIEFLCEKNRRIELNAMTSDEFIAWVEENLEVWGAGKVMPDEALLEAKARQTIAANMLRVRAAELEDEARRAATAAVLPNDLAFLVAGELNDDPALAWEEAVDRIVSRE